MPAHEKEAILLQLQGIWKIHVITSAGEAFVHEQALVHGEKIRRWRHAQLHNRIVGVETRRTEANANEGSQVAIHLGLVSPRGEIYLDNFGTIIKVEAGSDKVTMLTFMGGEQLWVKEATLGGGGSNVPAPPQVEMTNPYMPGANPLLGSGMPGANPMPASTGWP